MSMAQQNKANQRHEWMNDPESAEVENLSELIRADKNILKL